MSTKSASTKCTPTGKRSQNLKPTYISSLIFPSEQDKQESIHDQCRRFDQVVGESGCPPKSVSPTKQPFRHQCNRRNLPTPKKADTKTPKRGKFMSLTAWLDDKSTAKYHGTKTPMIWNAGDYERNIIFELIFFPFENFEFWILAPTLAVNFQRWPLWGSCFWRRWSFQVKPSGWGRPQLKLGAGLGFSLRTYPLGFSVSKAQVQVKIESIALFQPGDRS